MKSPMVVFGEDWGRHPSSTQHIVRRLACERRVIWMNSIGMRRPRLDRRDLGRVIDKLGLSNRRRAAMNQTIPAATSLPAGMVQLAPRAVSWPGSRIADFVNRSLLSRQVLKVLRDHNIERPILWTSLPTAQPVVGSIGERAVVYYCGDDFGALSGVDHEPVLSMERKLVEKADLILAASGVLAARFPRHKTLHVPHGADIALFETPVPRAQDLPSGRPIAGFYGSLSEWIDVELLSAAADALPDWIFYLIGNVETDVSELARRSNVVFAGKRDHQTLASYSQHWTVSLLPFRDTPQIRACNPLKLREYLAAGQPVVSTPFPAIEAYREVVSIADDRESFIRSIQAAQSATQLVEERQKRVRGETWTARAAQVEEALACL